MRVQKVAGALGSLVHDVDAAQLSQAEAFELRGLLSQRGVVFFRAQEIHPRTLQRLGGSLGEHDLRGHRSLDFPDFPGVAVLDTSKRANEWHSDLSYKSTPHRYTALLCVDAPSEGGDTMWADAVSAYLDLSPQMKTYIHGLRAVHTAAANGQPELSSEHPVVKELGESVRTLYVNRHYTDSLIGVPKAEGRAVLRFLFAHMEKVHYTCRWSWKPGDVAVWDNKRTLHIGVDDYPTDEQRRLYRCCILEPDRTTP